MIWLTWRQFRGSAAMTSAALVLLAAVLALTGPGLAADYATGLASCAPADCVRFFDRFFEAHQGAFMAVTVVVLVVPGLVGLFWGAPLIARELESGTHLLVWNQSMTRTRWLAVKLTLTGLAAVAAAGLCSLMVTWWSAPLDRSATPGFALMDPAVFAARGIVPLGYAAFAFVLGVAMGTLMRRTLPAMAVTLAIFAALQVAMPLLIRPHLLPPVSAAFELDPANVGNFGVPPDGSPRVSVDRAVPGHPGAWVLSSRLIDPSGRPAETDAAGAAVQVSVTSGPCAPPEVPDAGRSLRACLDEINRLGYRQAATYQPFERFWAFQWIETGFYAVLTLGLTGFCFWRVRRRVP
ncbi:ABC transporter permease [Nonomuraea terrae]|uniref:ABC transporter permease n=1 Tax=Nonomuraea terrae TaxID=2530383 RepID=UPI0037B14CD7